MKQYLNLLREIKENWVWKEDRTWTWVRSIFGMQAKYNLENWFPLVTTKKNFSKNNNNWTYLAYKMRYKYKIFSR